MQYTETQVTTGLLSLVAWAGNATAASKALKSEDKLNVTGETLRRWAKETHADLYNDMRERYSAQLESQLAHEFRDVARQAVEVQRLALDKSMQRLLSNDDYDPARTAANAARVAQSMTDKLLSLTGRPTIIREDRKLPEILRSLAARGVVELPPETGNLAEGNGVPDGNTVVDVAPEPE